MLHVGGGKPHHVERAVEIDVDDALEIGERHRAVAPDDALGRPDAGAIDEDARRPIALARFGSAVAACSASVTSQAIAWPPIRAATSRARLRSTSRQATLAPARASSLAVAAPRPEAPPVTTAACPLMSMINCSERQRRRDFRSAARCPGRRRCTPQRYRAAAVRA